MSVYFDDSLPTLVDVVVENVGSDYLSSGVVLRDTSGRLAFFATRSLDASTSETLSQCLRERLGAYARSDRVLAGPDDFGTARVLGDEAAVQVSVGANRVRLVDRRLVGGDWQRPPASAAPFPPRFVFASLKGGVGRSTALTVVAADLAARGLRVLALDLDIEAPGLGPMLLNDDSLPEFGVLDALVENGLSGLDDRFLADLIGPSLLASGRGRIDVIPVLGRRSLRNPADVLAKIARAYTEDSGQNGEVATFRDQIRSLVDGFAKTNRYDAVLVDARAGLHETTASSLMGLGAEVFVFGRDEPQTFQGFRVLLAHLARFVDLGGPPPEWLARLTLVQGQAPSKAGERIAFMEKCRDLVAEAGLGQPEVAYRQPVTLSGSFGDIPWDDESPDDEVIPNDEWGLRDPLAVLDDARFRGFDPKVRPDLLDARLYRSSFEPLLEQVRNCFASDEAEFPA